jgi:hypothetical protein
MKFILIMISLILLIILIYILFKYYNSVKNNPILIKGLVNGTSKSNVDENGENYPYKYIVNSDVIPYIDNSLIFGYSFWLYIDNVGGSGNWETSYDKEKTIINRGDSPSINYIPKNNSLVVNIKTGELNIEKFTCDRCLKSQKWNHICVILDNRNLDIYIEGKMIKSFILKEVPRLNTNDIYVFDSGNIYAEISYLRYFTMLLTPNDVELIYKTIYYKERILMGPRNDEIGSEIGTNNVHPTPTYFWWLLPWRNWLI